MNNEGKKLFAIFKNGIHLGNERGGNVDDAIRKYLIASLYDKSLNDIEFVSFYSGKVAIKNLHYS
ncbi:hypothetical protein [Polaribacter sp. L3A8]|uniref:hypothetical protein n=1 Tax=Polaribacter sp. L3A8 TaxID=2686361 RepID=UPI00131CBD19|nr:hypothetical protein [Polaribacter sp. L3A8]